MSMVPTIRLNTGAAMPRLGFGVWRISGREIEEALGVAIEAGYRSIDTAAAYGNEDGHMG